MESAKTLLILQKCLREVPDEILLLILDVLFIPNDRSVCAYCNRIEMIPEQFKTSNRGKEYQAYVKNSKKFFQENSWEVCYECYYGRFDFCHTCWIPLSESPILLKTTCGRYKKDGKCEICYENDEFHIEHILGYDPTDEEPTDDEPSDEEGVLFD